MVFKSALTLIIQPHLLGPALPSKVHSKLSPKDKKTLSRGAGQPAIRVANEER